MNKSIPTKIISLLMALVLVFSVAAVSVFADDTSVNSQSESSGEATPEPSATPEATTAPSTDFTIPDVSTDFYVYDEAALLSAETKQAILDKNKSLYEKYGVQVVVMTAKDLGGVNIKNYATEVFKKWKIGGDSENGVLLVVDIAGDTFYAMAGGGIGGAFPGTSLQDLLNTQLDPDFIAKSYDTGIKKFFDSAVTQIETYAATQPNLTKPDAAGGGGILGGIGIFLLVLVIIVAAFLAVIYVHGQMVRKKRQAARAARNARRRNTDSTGNSGSPSGGGRLPDNLSSYHSPSNDKYDFDEFKPRK